MSFTLKYMQQHLITSFYRDILIDYIAKKYLFSVIHIIEEK